MRVSVQMICFNAASVLPKGMLQACVAQIYPHVDEIIIVEGATMARTRKFDGDASSFTKNGGSTDGTLDILFSLPDPANKIVVERSRGWWDGKTAMCNEAANRATGDYIWQVDSDEFYHEKDVPAILQWLDADRPSAMHFFANHFWGGFHDIISKGSEHLWGADIPWKRIFRHYPGAKWISHEPPEYQLPDGRICNQQADVITREMTLARGVKLYHYGYVHQAQVDFKARFYRNPMYPKVWRDWQANHAAKLINGCCTEEFDGSHPSEIRTLITKLNA